MAEVIYSNPVLALRGKIGDSPVVFYAARGQQLVRAFTPPVNPNTPEQVVARRLLARASGQWVFLSDAQRDAWTAYAQAHFTREINGVTSAPTGALVYNKVGFFRQALGLELPGDAPAAGPPEPLAAFGSLPAAQPDAFVFAVEHGLIPAEGFKLVARITPGLPPTRKPLDRDLRYIKGIAPASFTALPPGGGAIAFSAARYEIPAGQNFRAELTVISPEGVPSLPLAATFRRILA